MYGPVAIRMVQGIPGSNPGGVDYFICSLRYRSSNQVIHNTSIVHQIIFKSQDNSD